ncbi:NAD(P)/FAD-dependent oxidoreductase [Nocardioides sp. T2.26MG-1]|uniref:NAD(P)/FAD-dependent oxidoreductase n=1 Tax=Nocardioides sp. T2.26MG-1 TaxID=3041166 RepID=UPI002477559A|nr:FAD-dependent oxidoreductase [Nocardioides sp. T2.26MG-1]CAI9410557.1 p-cumate 2,3-dioxygenase system, ferredoxin--NAD(+) reductase component [Nocardioides sp. T2.26MG-1]
MSTLRRVVVVGNGIAGLTAADTLRAEGYDGELVLVGDEPHPAYSRPALSKALLRDADDLTSHVLPPAGHGASELLGVRAVGLDADRRLVELDDGERLPYDGLVIASGCRPRRLGIAGERTLRSLDDALALRALVATRPSVLVVGGGPLGMEVASSCLAAGCAVTLTNLGPPLVDQLGPHLSTFVVDAALARGLRILPADAPRPPADVVITAVGDVSNTEWLGLDGAVPVDARGRWRPGIVAAGDVAAFPSGRTPLWTSAIEQSRVAAAALLHGDAAPAYVPRPYFWTEQFGLSIKAAGSLPAHGEPTVVDGEGDAVLLQWPGAAVAVNYRIPVPRLRRLTEVAAV